MSEQNQKQRVVVTGLGCVSSLGIGWQELWQNLIAGKSGISPVEAFDTSGYDRHYGGEVKNFDPTKFMSKNKAAKIGRASQMAIAASKLAIKDAGLVLDDNVRKRTAVCIGTTTGEIGILEKYNDGRFSKRDFFSKHFSVYPAHSLSVNIAREFKLRNRNCVFATACSSGNAALAYGVSLIRSGKADLALVGGADGFSRILFTGFSRLGAVAPQKCQPFDRNRQGMIPAEGAAILLLESHEHAIKRNAKIYAEILGSGLSSDAYHMTQPRSQGVAKAINKALKNSGIASNRIDYISAHGTGTVENDKAECEAYKEVFEDALKTIPVSSVKSMLGHTMGASSALESIVCCLAMKYGEIPPTINYQENDPECLINCVPNKSLRKKINIILNNSQAFGGSNVSIILSVIR